MSRFKPSVYSNQRPFLTPRDLNFHPLASDYITYTLHIHYPVDFNTWLKRRKNETEALKAQDAMKIAVMQNDPYCRSPLKIRKHK